MFESFFQCPVVFGAEVNRLSFSGQALKLTMRQANPDYSDHLDVYLERAVYEVGAREMAQNSRTLVNLLLEGEPELPGLAHRPGMSERSLQCYLMSQGLGFISWLVVNGLKWPRFTYLSRAAVWPLLPI